MCTQQAFPPPWSMWTCPNSSQFSILELWGWTCTGKRWTFCTTRPGEFLRWPDVKHSNGPKVRRFLLFFFARLFDLGGGNSSIFSCSPRKLGKMKPILTFAYVSLDGLVKKSPKELFMLLQWYWKLTKSAGHAAAWGWSSDGYPGDQASGMMGMYVVLGSMPRVFGKQPPTLEGDTGRWCLDGEFLDEFLARRLCLCWMYLLVVLCMQTLLEFAGLHWFFSKKQGVGVVSVIMLRDTLPETNISIHIPWKSIIGRCMSYWNSPFSGDVNFWRGKAAVFDFYWNVDWTKTKNSLGNSMHWVNLDQLFVVIQDSIAVKDSFCAADQKGATLRHLCGDWWTGECLEGCWNGWK